MFQYTPAPGETDSYDKINLQFQPEQNLNNFGPKSMEILQSIPGDQARRFLYPHLSQDEAFQRYQKDVALTNGVNMLQPDHPAAHVLNKQLPQGRLSGPTGAGLPPPQITNMLLNATHHLNSIAQAAYGLQPINDGVHGPQYGSNNGAWGNIPDDPNKPHPWPYSTATYYGEPTPYVIRDINTDPAHQHMLRQAGNQVYDAYTVMRYPGTPAAKAALQRIQQFGPSK